MKRHSANVHPSIGRRPAVTPPRVPRFLLRNEDENMPVVQPARMVWCIRTVLRNHGIDRRGKLRIAECPRANAAGKEPRMQRAILSGNLEASERIARIVAVASINQIDHAAPLPATPLLPDGGSEWR